MLAVKSHVVFCGKSCISTVNAPCRYLNGYSGKRSGKIINGFFQDGKQGKLHHDDVLFALCGNRAKSHFPKTKHLLAYQLSVVVSDKENRQDDCRFDQQSVEELLFVILAGSLIRLVPQRCEFLTTKQTHVVGVY